MIVLPVVYAIGWPRAGRSTVSPIVVHSISAVLTMLFMVGLSWLARGLPAGDVRRQVGRLLLFRPRDGRLRRIAQLVLIAALGSAGVAHAQTPAAPAVAPSPAASPAAKPDPFAFADFSWVPGNYGARERPLASKAFTGEFRVDPAYHSSFNRTQ